MSAASKWAEKNCGMFSQSFGNINVSESALSRLIEERDTLTTKNAELVTALTEALRTVDAYTKQTGWPPIEGSPRYRWSKILSNNQPKKDQQ